MNDTPANITRLVDDIYARMTPLQRFAVVSSLRQTAIALIEASLPASLPGRERRYAIAKRLYGDELSEAALQAHAHHPETSRS
jgi:hypothetical protein